MKRSKRQSPRDMGRRTRTAGRGASIYGHPGSRAGPNWPEICPHKFWTSFVYYDFLHYLSIPNHSDIGTLGILWGHGGRTLGALWGHSGGASGRASGVLWVCRGAVFICPRGQILPACRHKTQLLGNELSPQSVAWGPHSWPLFVSTNSAKFLTLSFS